MAVNRKLYLFTAIFINRIIAGLFIDSPEYILPGYAGIRQVIFFLFLSGIYDIIYLPVSRIL